MIALNSSDKLRADASVADKIDYTLHGVSGDVVTQLADGQFAAAEADIYTAPSAGTIVVTIILVNRHNAAVTCNLYLKPSGGTSRYLLPVDVSLNAGESLCYDGFNVILSDQGSSVSITAQPADTFVAEDGALGKGVLLQGDDGADRKNIAVNAQGELKTVDHDGGDILLAVQGVDDGFQAEGAALGTGVLLQGDDGTDRHNIAVDASGNVQVDMVGALPAGSAAIGKLAANSGVDIGDVDVKSHPADIFVAEDGALGKGVLLQGDDGTDRHNVAVDTDGHLQVDVQSGGGSNDSVATEGVAASKGTQISLDDGTDSHYAQANAAGDLKVTLDSEAVVLGGGSAAIGKLGANSGVDIGDVDVLSLPTLPAGTNAIGKLAANDGVDIGDVDVKSQPADTFAAEGQALGKGVLLQGDDGTDRHNIAVDASGNVQGDVIHQGKLAAWTQILVNINTATTTELKAANAGHTYTVIDISLTIAAENNLTWKTASTALSGPMDFGASGEPHGWQANFWPHGLKCVAGEALNLTTTTTGQVSGFIMILDES
jgi:hypothetical protein